MHAELFDDLRERGFDVRAADLGENVTTRGVDLLGLPKGALLQLGDSAVIEITGLRNPCRQIDDFQRGLLAAVLERTSDGQVIKKAGVMGVVKEGGLVRVNDPIAIKLPPPPHQPLEGV